MAKFYVDDMNAGATGPYTTLEEALADANNNLGEYRANARYDGWDLDEGDLSIYEVPDDFDTEESELREHPRRAMVVETDIRPVEEPGTMGFDYTCDMQMKVLAPSLEQDE